MKGVGIETLQKALATRREIDRLEKRLAALLGELQFTAKKQRVGRRLMSAATRAKLASLARARWKKRRKSIPTGNLGTRYH